MMAIVRERFNGNYNKVLLSILAGVITIALTLIGAWANAQMDNDKAIKAKQDELQIKVIALEAHYADIEASLRRIEAKLEKDGK
jgi:hypothetical protein